MRDKNFLIDLLIRNLFKIVSSDICLCSALEFLYIEGHILFNEMKFLQKLIDNKIELSLMDEIIEFNNYKLFIEKLNALKD